MGTDSTALRTVFASIEDYAALRRELAERPAIVCPRGSDRTKDQTEAWCVHRLLASIGASLSYPLELSKSERPDFVLKQGELKVGIEVTVATSESYEKCRTLAAQEYPDAVWDIGHFRPNSPVKNKDEVKEILESDRFTSLPWYGDAPETEWVDYVRKGFEKKVSKLKSEGYKVYPSNWLLVYMNAPLPSLHHEVIVGMIAQPSRPWFDADPTFDAIFVISDNKLFKIERSGIALEELLDPTKREDWG